MARKLGASWLVSAVCLVFSALTVESLSPFSPVEVESSLGLVESGDKGSFSSLEAAYFSARVHQVAKTSVPDSLNPCSWLASAGKKISTASESFYALKLAQIWQCGTKASIVTTAEAVLLESASKASDLEPLYFSILGLSHIKESRLSENSGKFFEALSASLESLKALSEEASWKLTSGAEATSAFATGLALEAGATLIRFGVLSEKPELFETAAKNLLDDKSYLSDIASLSASLKGAVALASAIGKLPASPESLLGASGKLLVLSASSAVEAFRQLDALDLLNENSIFVPLAVDVPPHLSLTKTLILEASVSTVLGKVPEKGIVTARTGKGKVFSRAENDKFVVETPGKLGSLEINIQLESTDPRHFFPEKFSHVVRVTGPLELTEGKISVFEGGASSPETEFPLSLGQTVPSTISANHLQKISLSFSVKGPSGDPFSPQQVFLKLTHETGVSHDYVVSPNKGEYAFKLDLLESMERLFFLSGLYSLQLTFGDSLIENSQQWNLANLDLDFPSPPESAPKPPPTLPSLESRYQPQKEILHIFRVPEKRPSYLVSVTFLALAILPLLALFLGLGALGINFSAFPTSGIPLFGAVLFHGGVASILLLYVSFWVKLNLFYTLKALLVLALFTAIPGHVILSHLANSPKAKAE